MITLRPWRATDAEAVVSLVTAIQQREFGLPIAAADQPDLLDVATHYARGHGGFWVAEADGRVVGSLGLLDIGDGHGVLRKMFVDAGWRGPVHGIAQRLLALAGAHAAGQGLRQLWLGTTEAFAAAHRFYARQGFERVDAAALPAAFPRMALDTRFYRRGVGTVDAAGTVEAGPC